MTRLMENPVERRWGGACAAFGLVCLALFGVIALVISESGDIPQDSTFTDALKSGAAWMVVIGIVAAIGMTAVGLLDIRAERRSKRQLSQELWGLALVFLGLLIVSFPVGALVEGSRSALAWIGVAIAASIVCLGVIQFSLGRIHEWSEGESE